MLTLLELDELLTLWSATVRLADRAVLASRMSQLKPAAFKWGSMQLYILAFAALGGAIIIGLFWTGIAAAREEDTMDDPPTADR